MIARKSLSPKNTYTILLIVYAHHKLYAFTYIAKLNPLFFGRHALRCYQMTEVRTVAVSVLTPISYMPKSPAKLERMQKLSKES
jgi:hypothetical protein